MENIYLQKAMNVGGANLRMEAQKIQINFGTNDWKIQTNFSPKQVNLFSRKKHAKEKWSKNQNKFLERLQRACLFGSMMSLHKIHISENGP